MRRFHIIFSFSLKNETENYYKCITYMGKYRTNGLNPALEPILQKKRDIQKEKNRKRFHF